MTLKHPSHQKTRGGGGRWLRVKTAAKSFALEKNGMQKLVQMSLEPGTRSNVSEGIGAPREGRKQGASQP